MLDALDALTFPAFATCLLALIAACGQVALLYGEK